MQQSQEDSAELSVALLGAQHDESEMNEIHSDTAPASRQGDLEQGLLAGADTEAEAEALNKSEQEAIEVAARESCQSGPVVYLVDLIRLAIFYWAIVSDALLMKELYSQQYMVFAGLSTGFTVGPHVFMSLLLIIRQGWLQAASQACGFILTLNPFESLTPIPQGILGLFVISIGFIAYVLIAASGLIFVAYCVVCYLVTALLFSLLILDLAALVITVAPSKGIFKYTDLVYTENFKFSRLVLQAWLQSAPELVMICLILYRDWSKQGPAVVINGPILLQAFAAHLINLWDKTCMFRSAAAFAGASCSHHLLSLLQVKGSCRLSLPVLRENLNRVLRGAGGADGGAALGSVVHISSAEEAADNDSEAAASMVPEYLTPTNGGLLSPGQLMALVRAVLGRYGGPGVAELVLEVTPDVMIGKLLCELVGSIPNTSSVRLVNASVRGRDAAMLATALLQCGSLRTLQLHQAVVDERGALALMQLLEHTPTLQQLDLCRCKLRRKAPQALAQGLRCNKTVRQLNLAGSKGLDEAGASALAAALACSKVLCALNLAFVKLSSGAVDSLVQAISGSTSLRVLAVSQDDLPAEGGKKLIAAVSALRNPKAPPSLTCNLTLGTFPLEGLDKVQWVAVRDQDALIMDAWQGLAGGGSEGLEDQGAGGSGGLLQRFSTSCRGLAPSDVAGCGLGVSADESAPLLSPAVTAAAPAAGPSSSSNSRLQGVTAPHAPASAFDVASPVPAGFASTSSSNLTSNAAAAAAAWFSSSTGACGSNDSGGVTAYGTSGAMSGSSSCCSRAASGTVPSAADANCPTLVFIVMQDDVVNCMVRAPLLFNELDTLDLTGLGVEDEGAKAMAKVLEENPAVRRVILADNKIGEEGGAALAAAITLNHTLQVLDLSANELSETGVAVLAEATKRGPGLRQLRLLGNKIPFGLSTLRKLVEAEKASPHCHLVLVEDPSEVLDDLARSGDTRQAAQAEDFYTRQEQYRTSRRQRMAARQQKLQRLEAQAAAAAAAGSQRDSFAAAAAAPGSTDEMSVVCPSLPDVEAPAPIRTSGSSMESDTAAAAAAAAAEIGGMAATAAPTASPSSSNGSAAVTPHYVHSCSEVFRPTSPKASGSVSSVTADEETCGVCFDNNNHVAIKYCGHRLCVDCYRKVWELSGAAATCPFCRSRLEGYLYLDWPLEP